MISTKTNSKERRRPQQQHPEEETVLVAKMPDALCKLFLLALLLPNPPRLSMKLKVACGKDQVTREVPLRKARKDMFDNNADP